MGDSNFVDYVKIHCTSGNGGAGSVHLHRDRMTSKGGPDGGDGGRGGHIILKGNKNLWTLLEFRYKKHVKAKHGKDGGASRSQGADGADLILEVPLGTVAKDAETTEVLFEVEAHNETHILLQGGAGGRGNWHFRSATNQTPRYAQSGIKGKAGWKVLELKVLADVGFVGFPNAGKSTLLSVITAAKPKIANYPFTTLKPNLGIVNYRDQRSFVVADIPGIIEGASEGKGLGYRFLRHIERNSTLLFIIPVDADDIQKEYEILLDELKKYNPDLLNKNRVLAISKLDMIDDKLKREIARQLPDIPTVFISSMDQQGLSELKDLLWEKLK